MKPIQYLTLLVFLLVACAPTRQVPTTTPTPFSCVESGTVRSLKVVGFGDIGLYLPPCYDASAAAIYPVLYLLPGFSGTHREWLDIGIAPLTDQSIRNGDIPPFLIVTTDNTYDYIQPEAIVTALLPYIESHYRVSPNRLHRAIAGGSLGGASAYLLTFQHPDIFANAGVFGNGLVTGQEAQDAIWLSAIPEALKPRIFLNSGEQDTFMLQQAKLLIPILDQYKVEHMEIFSAGGHDGRYWLTNFPAFYQWLSEDWQE